MTYSKKTILCNKLCNRNSVIKIEISDIMSKVSVGKLGSASGRDNAKIEL